MNYKDLIGSLPKNKVKSDPEWREIYEALKDVFEETDAGGPPKAQKGVHS